ncbi:MAG: winged helix-turn-helix domain-containing protein [Anaerolineae bacterium]|nr:winged helix-turn-helix domain-containing protein [Anaerolineae bacterium]
MGEQPAAPGLGAFDSLRAEDEPWLAACFVPPQDFDLIAGARSVLIFGPPGAGKTALFLALQRHLNATGRLVVEWQPPQPGRDASQSLTAIDLFHHVLSRIACALLAYLTERPDRFMAAPSRQAISWFIYRYLDEEMSPQQERLLGMREPHPWLEGRPAAHLINELVKAWRKVGISATVVLTALDGPPHPGQGLDGLGAFFSTLTLFENRGLVYKVIAPAGLKTPLALTGSVDRRRVDTYFLRWSAQDLVEMVLRRMTLAAGEPIENLSALCEDADLVHWLENTGGGSPRGWLESVRPLAVQRLAQGRPVQTAEWHCIRQESPPPLMFDAEDPHVVVTGWRRIDDLPEVPLALLRYLYDHRGRVCSRNELFHQAYLPARYPDVAEREREMGIDYRSLLDTTISRLRDRIEPDPRRPIYIITSRGQGYKLEHAW